MKIVSYKPLYAQAFKDLNVAWLEKYFYVEPYDLEILSKSQELIIDKGGHIFFVLINNQVAGTVALFKEDEHWFELTKMAIDPKFQGQKLGQQLLQYCIEFAKDRSKHLFLYSHTKLENAIYIYRKFGFVEVPLTEENPYERSDIKMVLKLE